MSLNIEQRKQTSKELKTNYEISELTSEDIEADLCISCVRNHIKLKHRAVFGTSIKEKYRNNGIRNALIREVIE